MPCTYIVMSSGSRPVMFQIFYLCLQKLKGPMEFKHSHHKDFWEIVIILQVKLWLY